MSLPRQAALAVITMATLGIAFLGIAVVVTSTRHHGGESPRLRVVEPAALTDGTRTVIFLTIINDGGPDQLMGATSPTASSVSLAAGDVTAGLESMSMAMPGMTMHMKAVPIAAHGTVVLERHGPHLELVGSTGSQEVGQDVDVSLVFARAGQIRVQTNLGTSEDPIAMPTPSGATAMPAMPAGGQAAMRPGGQAKSGRTHP